MLLVWTSLKFYCLVKSQGEYRPQFIHETNRLKKGKILNLPKN